MIILFGICLALVVSLLPHFFLVVYEQESLLSFDSAALSLSQQDFGKRIFLKKHELPKKSFGYRCKKKKKKRGYVNGEKKINKIYILSKK